MHARELLQKETRRPNNVTGKEEDIVLSQRPILVADIDRKSWLRIEEANVD